MTRDIAASVLLLVLLLQAKHFICDGPLQTKEMVHFKGIYGKPLGMLHSAIHGAGSLVVFWSFGLGAAMVLALAAIDFVIHYHIDFTKETIVRRNGWTVADKQFWWSISFDQFLHHVTYIAFVAYVFALF